MNTKKVKKIILSKAEGDELIGILGNSEVSFNNATEQMEEAAKEELNAEQSINDLIDYGTESPTPIDEEAKKEMRKAFLQMKKLLKPRSKGELIELMWTYGVQLQELQHVCQILLEENKSLKGE